MTDEQDTRDTGGFLIMGQFAWGYGDTLKEAKTNWQKNGGRLSKGYSIFEFDDETTFKGVDQIGNYYWSGNKPMEKVVKARK